jgi:hypothetical protein
MPKSIMATLKEELGAESPAHVLEKVQALKATATNGQGPLGITLTMSRTAPRYNHALIGVMSLEDWQRLQGMVNHFLREVLAPEVQRMEVEAEVQRRLNEGEHQQP